VLANEPRRDEHGTTATFDSGGLPLGTAGRGGGERDRLRLYAHRWPDKHAADPRLRATGAIRFCGGAILAFAFIGALAFGGVRGQYGEPPKRIQLWGSFHFLSVGLAVSVAYLVGAHVPDALGWPVGAFAATATYLIVVGFENSAADLERRRS
jgi:hypothetical protein